jgi:diamine N-acetyltransferase
MKREITPFAHGSVRLRLIAEADLESTLAWRNHDESRIWFKTSNLLTLEQHRAWFHRYQDKDDDFLFVVEVGEKVVGQASVYGIDWANGCAEVGRFLVAPGERRKGYISQACVALIGFCAENLGLSYLFLEVFEANSRAIRLYQRCGFAEESRYDGMIRMGRGLERQ